MPKTRRNNADINECTQNAKRKRCGDPCSKQQNESLLWSGGEESFFTNFQIDEIFTDNIDGGNCNNLNNFHNTSDDSLFSDICIPESSSSEGNVGSTPILVALPSDIGDNDTLFKNINLDDLADKLDEDEDIFKSEVTSKDDVVQNTQQFLNDVVLKMSMVPKKKKEKVSSNICPTKTFVSGTQYETHEDILNRTMQPKSGNDTLHLTMSCWESQPFTQTQTYNFPSKGDFYGLPDKVRQMIFDLKGLKSLYEWQQECLSLPAIKRRNNLIYALPTSGGKTLVAEILMLREVICRQKNVIFILPYVSIVQEKVSALAPFAIACDFIVDEYTAGRGKCPPVPRKKRTSIFVASIEKGAVLFDSLIDAQRANEIGLVVVDELHLIGEKGRGATLEALLTKIMFINAGIQIVGMSATIGNLSEISTFLKADIYTRGFRPIELKEYIKCGKDILKINPTGKGLEEIFTFHRSVEFKYSPSVARADPDHLAGLVTECAPQNCCLIFCPTRKNCESVALLLSRILPKEKFFEHRKSEKADLMDALDKVCGILSPILAKTIPFGIAYHHSGLTTDERRFIETAYRFNVISIICCTSTLAAGVNLPAKRVIIRSPYVGNEFMTLCKYKQMVGRAGRAGISDEAGESILITQSRDNVRVSEMLFSPMDKAISSLNIDEGIGLQSLILSAVGLELANCRKKLYQLIDSTLMAVQKEHLDIRPHELVMDVLRQMFKNKVLQIGKCDTTIEIITSQDKSNLSAISKRRSQQTQNTREQRTLMVGRNTRFELTEMGRAAFKAGIDYKRTYVVYNEIKLAQKHLILSNYAHLLYLVICFISNSTGDELFAADAVILVKAVPNLNDATQALFTQLGFTEAHLARIARTLSIQGPMQLKMNRLFKTLVLLDVLAVKPIPDIAIKFNIERGILQNLISQATAATSALVRLCEEVPEFWCFQPLFERLIKKIDRCGTVELEALLDLPAVKINRAKQLYAAGFHTIEDIARAQPIKLVKSVEHMPLRIAKEIISAAKIILMKKLDHLEEETEALKICLRRDSDEGN